MRYTLVDVTRVIQLSVAGLLAASVVGCATTQPRRNVTAGSHAESAKDTSGRANLKLDQIEPMVALPATKPVAPNSPPLKALELYARARSALIDNQRFTAIQLLQQATQIDRFSAEPYRLLALARLGNSTFNDDAISALETAVELDPLDLLTRVDLGRQYLAKGDLPRALAHLRIALQTPDYVGRDDDAAITDLFLAKALEQGDYDRAAVEQYEVLLSRLRTRNLSLRRDPQLSVLVSRPELVATEIGRLYEKLGDYDSAIAALSSAIDPDDPNVGLQARIVRLKKNAGHTDEAISDATDLVRRVGATATTVALLNEVCRGQPASKSAVAQLQSLLAADPDNRSILFALSDTLRAEGHTAEATNVLLHALGEQAASIEITRKLFGVYDQQNQLVEAAKLVIHAVAKNPDSISELGSLWPSLVRPWRTDHLRPADVEAIPVSKEEDAAKLYFVAETHEALRHTTAKQKSLEAAVRMSPSFAPAYRDLQQLILDDATAKPADRKSQLDTLARSAAEAGAPGLAAELRARVLLHDDNARGAVSAITGDDGKPVSSDPVTVLVAATAHDRAGEAAQCQQILWRLISDRPLFGPAYETLFTHYLTHNDSGAAVKTLNGWVASDPTSVDARLLQASVYRRAGQDAAAETILQSLLEEQPRNDSVVSGMYVQYFTTNKLDELIARLEPVRSSDLSNRAVVEILVQAYADQNRLSDAVRVIDEARQATRATKPSDADVLYFLSGLYSRVNQTDSAERTLEQVVALEPSHSGASNDLGYTLAESGRTLERAEKLVRVAVVAEPENASYLDSLGWVLYKRGKFAEAKQYLSKAASPVTDADPVVLDHLGDALYRLNLSDEAKAAWQQSLERIGNDGDTTRNDLKDLKLKLMQKLRQAEAGQAVNVAPIPPGNQARSE